MQIAEKVVATDCTVEASSSLPRSWPDGGNASEARCFVFQTREFLRSWQQSYGKSKKFQAIYIEVTGGNGDLWYQIPFSIETRGGLKVLTFLDQGHADYNCPVVHPAAPRSWERSAAMELWHQIAGSLPHYDVAYLEKIAPGIGGFDNPFFRITDEDAPDFCHGNNLTLTWPEIEATQFNLKTLKRYGRRLQDKGETRLVIAQTEKDGRDLLERLIIQKQRRFEETLVPTFKENPTALEFLHRATENFSASGNLLIAALVVGDQQTAITWGLTKDRHFYSLVMGFEDGIWRKYSCGRILNLRLLSWLKDNGFEYLDHGYGDEEYKVRSCDTTVPLKQAILPSSPLGKLHLMRKNFVSQLKSTAVWQRLRPLKWILINALRKRTGKN